jgi:hypothetical protein
MSVSQFPFSIGPFSRSFLPFTTPPIFAVTPEQWALLNGEVEGRLSSPQPWAAPCFSEVDGISQAVNSSACEFVKTNYLDGVARSLSMGAMSNTQWEGCQVTGEQCLLDWTNPSNSNATDAPYRCNYGSISRVSVSSMENSPLFFAQSPL